MELGRIIGDGMDKETREYIICRCGLSDHMMVFHLWESDEPGGSDLIVEMHLIPFGFPFRLKTAIHYLLGKRTNWGCFENLLLSREDAQRIINLLSRYIETKED